MGITISTHFSKPKLGQKHNSLHAKNSKNVKIHSICIKNKNKMKMLQTSPKKQLEVCSKTTGVFFKKSLENLLNSKLSNLILHLEPRTEIKGNN
jgi:hypothetical protein